MTAIHWAMSGEVVLMTLLGGLGAVFGPVVGALVLLGDGELSRIRKHAERFTVYDPNSAVHCQGVR